VAICTLSNRDLPVRLIAAGEPAVAIAGRCDTEKIGVEKVVLNLLANPRIRWLVICGTEAKGHRAGDAFLRLKERGVDVGFRLRKVTDLMVTHLEDEFSLIRLAREADMSEFHFSRAFKRTTGLTPSQYFIHLRLEKAHRLLRETNRSVIEIGLDVGYTSPSHFAQIFRREVGISPSEYRRLA